MGKYETCRGIWNLNAVQAIKKSENYMQPIFEGVTNSIEAIQEKFKTQINKGKINVSIYLTKQPLLGDDFEYNFDKILIEDNGIGLNDNCYERLINLRDDRKGYSNKGTGRVQYLHSFNFTTIESAYSTSKKNFKYRKVVLSKSNSFCKENALVRLDDDKIDETITESFTKLSFANPLDQKQSLFLVNMTLNNYKLEILRHFLALFCEFGKNLPRISLCRFENNEKVNSLTIEEKDIPVPDKTLEVKVQYSRKSKKNVEKLERVEDFKLRCFKLNDNSWDKNKLLLVSKGELAKEISLYDVNATDSFEGFRFLFLLSGEYLDNNDSDTRGEINLLTKKEFKSADTDLFLSKEKILLDDIESESNKAIINKYPVIAKSQKNKNENLEKLKSMFLLRPSIVESLRNKIKITDTDKDILKKVYSQEVAEKAENDANLKLKIEKIRKLDPSQQTYQEDLKAQVDEFTLLIPLQNRTALTQYVTRRKLILEVFDELLKKSNTLEDNANSETVKEKLFHNLFFKQRTDNPEQSDMWLLNEDFVFFAGVSESELSKAEVSGEKLFKDILTPEEQTYKDKMNRDAGKRRPDVLLFPEEGKCIIVEYKAPDVNVSGHIHQINRYAALIHNLSCEKFHFDTFYGYYVGENIDIDDIQDVESSFIEAYKQNYIFRPYYRVPGKFGKKDGSLYTEIIKYSDILERAQRRNKIFINFLTKSI